VNRRNCSAAWPTNISRPLTVTQPAAFASCSYSKGIKRLYASVLHVKLEIAAE